MENQDVSPSDINSGRLYLINIPGAVISTNNAERFRDMSVVLIQNPGNRSQAFSLRPISNSVNSGNFSNPEALAQSFSVTGTTMAYEQGNRNTQQEANAGLRFDSRVEPESAMRNLNFDVQRREAILPQTQELEIPRSVHFVEEGQESEAIISPRPYYPYPTILYRSPTRSPSPANSVCSCGCDDTWQGPRLRPVSPLTIPDPEFQPPPPTVPSSPVIQLQSEEPPFVFVSLDNAVNLTPESFSPYGDLLVPDPDLIPLHTEPARVSKKRARRQSSSSFRKKEKAPPLPPQKLTRFTNRGPIRSRAILDKYIPGGICSLCSEKKRKPFGSRSSRLEHLVTQHLVQPVKNMFRYKPEQLAEYTETQGHLIENEEQYDYTREYIDAVKCGLCAWDTCLVFREKSTNEHLWKTHWKLDETVRQEEKERLDKLVPNWYEFYSLQDKFLYNFPFSEKEGENVQKSLVEVVQPSEREPEHVQENVNRRSDSENIEWFSEGEPDNVRKSIEWSDSDDENLSSQLETSMEQPVDHVLIGLDEFFD